MTLIYSHPDCLGHVTPPGHPEQVARLEAILPALRALEGLEWRESPLAERADLLRAHPEDYIARIEAAVPESGWVSIDGDTHVMAGSLQAALRAAGGICAAVDAVLDGEARSAFCAGRPPGHHAERETAMGFCLFSNAALAAKRALDHHGLLRVALVDFDVHHGNGSQDVLWAEERCCFVSSHQMPLYPGTGDASETGTAGNIVNLPLAPGAGRAAFRQAWEDHALPTLERFQPELVLISAGFDAHKADPLAQMTLDEADFEWITHRLCDLAEAHAGGRIVSTLEGGYDLDALASSAAAHVAVLRERG